MTVSDLSALVMRFAAGFRDRNRVIGTIYRGRRGDRRPYRHAFASMGLPCATASNLRLLLLVEDRLLLLLQSDKDFEFPLCGFAPSLFPRSTNATEGNLNTIKSPARIVPKIGENSTGDYATLRFRREILRGF